MQRKKQKSIRQASLLGVAHAQGRRPEMEDGAAAARIKKWSVFAVFDGHGGDTVSKWLAANLVQIVLKRLNDVDLDPTTGPTVRMTIAKLLTKTFLDVDKRLLTDCRHNGSGSTAVVLINRGRHSFVANLGDSRAVWFSSTGTDIRSTIDQTPALSTERKRAESAGATVHTDPTSGISRVHPERRQAEAGYGLSLSRAFGDFDMKPVFRPERKTDESINDRIIRPYDPINAAVSCVPRITHFVAPINQTTIALLACDGLFDVLDNRTAAALTCQLLTTKPATITSDTTAGPRFDVAKALVDRAISLGSTDNVSVMLVSIR